MAVVWVLMVGTSLAEDAFLGQGATPVEGPETELLEHAVETNARLFGAVNHLESRIFPLLDAANSGVGFYIGGTFGQTWDVLRVPANCPTLAFPLKSGTSCVVHADMFAASGGAAVGNQHVALFYAAGWNGVYASTDQVVGIRGLAPLMLAGISAFQIASAPLQTGPAEIGDGLDDVFGLSRIDYIVGLRGGYAGVSAHAGYYGSDDLSGFYTNLTEERTRAILSVVVREKRDDIPYFLAGVVDSPLMGRILDEASIRPTLFARKLNMLPPDFMVTSLGPEPVIPEAELWTGHAGSTSRFADALVAIAWKPDVMVHQLVVAIHTPDYPSSIAAMTDENFEPDEKLGARLAFGVIQAPGMPWYGVVSRSTPFVELRAGVWEGGFAELVLGYNSQELLAQFPYARHSFHLRFDYHLLGYNP